MGMAFKTVDKNRAINCQKYLHFEDISMRYPAETARHKYTHKNKSISANVSQENLGATFIVAILRTRRIARTL